MATRLEVRAVEKSTYIVTAMFTDENRNAVTPNSGLKWKLTDKNGVVINSQEDVDLVEASSIDIVISGDDLAIQTGESGNMVRVVTVYGTYDSDAGNNLPIKGACEFIVDNLVAIT